MVTYVSFCPILMLCHPFCSLLLVLTTVFGVFFRLQQLELKATGLSSFQMFGAQKGFVLFLKGERDVYHLSAFLSRSLKQSIHCLSLSYQLYVCLVSTQNVENASNGVGGD